MSHWTTVWPSPTRRRKNTALLPAILFAIPFFAILLVLALLALIVGRLRS
jgi:hypothetical protein